jgi:hypothetical protein
MLAYCGAQGKPVYVISPIRGIDGFGVLGRKL